MSVQTLLQQTPPLDWLTVLGSDGEFHVDDPLEYPARNRVNNFQLLFSSNITRKPQQLVQDNCSTYIKTAWSPKSADSYLDK